MQGSAIASASFRANVPFIYFFLLVLIPQEKQRQEKEEERNVRLVNVLNGPAKSQQAFFNPNLIIR